MDYCDLPGRYVGISVPADRMILIDTLEMVSSYEYLYVVSYHELSHYYLDNGHESCNMCIMMPVITLRQALLIYYNRERYKKRLFK